MPQHAEIPGVTLNLVYVSELRLKSRKTSGSGRSILDRGYVF